MGRNNDTFTLAIERNKEKWMKFRRGLRKEEQPVFDEMWRAPKLHLASGAFLANETPLETIFMSMLLDQYKKIKRLEAGLPGQLIVTADQAEHATGVPDSTP